jgi:hypothetical protein
MHAFIYDLKDDRIRSQRAKTKQCAQQRRSDWQQLEKLDRYERRALSRRRAAIRTYDEAQAAHRDQSQ